MDLKPSFEDSTVMTSRNSDTVQKRDLHVGGIGNGSAGPTSGTFSMMADPIVDIADSFVTRARDVIRNADDYVHDNPWAAVGVVALLGLTAGFFLSRRS